MTPSNFGSRFRFSVQDEREDGCVGLVVEGCPSGLSLNESEFQPHHKTSEVKILDGVTNGQTNGSPIHLQIKKMDSGRKEDSHLSGPITAGTVAKKILGAHVIIKGATIQVGPHLVDRSTWNWNEVDNNTLHSPNQNAAKFWENYLEQIKKAGLSVGTVIEITARGLPAGLGQTNCGGLASSISSALFSLRGVKGVEIGNGFASAVQTGDIYAETKEVGADGTSTVLSNNSGGINNGHSTGQDIVIRYAVKPTDLTGFSNEKNYHPCVGILSIPAAESLIACVLADAVLKQKDIS